MPRLSSEAISASLWREDDPIPQPPAYLKGDARKVFLEVASAYPSERWGAAGLHLLEVFAVTTSALRRVMVRVQATDAHDPESRPLTSMMVKLTSFSCRRRRS